MNISVKKFSKKSLSLLIALIMVFSALPLTPPISADAATVSKSVKVANYGVLSSGGRIDSNVFEIVNDGRNGNFSIGCVRFNISNLEAYKHEVTSAMYNISHYAKSSRTNNMYIGFYYPTKNLDTYSLTNGSATNSGTFYSNIFNNTNDSNHTHISAAKSYFGLQEITTVLSRADDSTNSVSIDIAPLINYALKNNTTATLMIMLTAYDQTDNSAPWSDRKVTVSTSDFNVTANEKTFSTEVTSSNNANSTTNRVKIGDAIYTYESSSAYYNYGKTISTESPWNTPISTTKPISSVECMDDGSLLTVSNSNKLSGTFYDNKFKVSENTSVNATLKFTFSDGKIEYHRVAVKSYPVENHVCVFADRSGESEAGYTMFLRGSTGSGGSGVWNYNKSYYTSGNTAHGSPDRNCVVSDKKAYVYGYSYSNWNNNNDAVPSVSLATYYIDKSCSGTSWSSLGNSELWNSSTNNYSISIDLVRTKFQYPLGDGWTLDLNNSPVQGKLTIPQNPQKSDVNGTTYTSTFTHNSSVSTSNRYSSCNDTTCNVRLAVHAHDKGWALMKTNMVVNLFDKSAARNLYIDYLNENKVSDSYTASSFAAYQNALLDMEAYLSNYEDTTNATTSQLVYTKLVNAHNGLTARGDISALEAAYAKYKDIVANRNKYTTDSYNSWNEIALDPTLIDFEQLTSAQKRDLTASDVETYKAPFDKLNYELLVLRADSSVFSLLDNQVTIAREKLSLDNVNYTENSKNALQTALDNATYKGYTDSQKANTPKSVEKDIYNQYLNIFNAITALAYDKTSQQDVYNAYVEAKNSKNESCYTSSDWQNYTLRIKDLATWLADDTNGNITEFNSLVTTLDNTIATMEANHKANHYKYTYDSVNNQHTYGCENGCSVDTPIVSNCTYSSSTENHISTVECSICHGNFSLDYTVYDALVEELNDKLSQTAKYSNTETCKEKFNEITALSTPITNVMSQADIEVLLGRLNDEVDKALTLAQYQITFNVVDEFGKTTETVINAQSYDYGTLLNLQLPDTYQENAVSAWKRNIDGADSVVGATSHSLQVMVTGKATYTAFVKKATTTPVNHVVITLNNKSNKVYDIGYVAISNSVPVTVDVDNGTITIGGKKLTAPTYSFYKVKGFKINGDTVNTGTINITGDIVIMPEYEAITTFEITGGNGVVEKSTRTSWDKRVKLTAQTPAQSGKINKWTSTINGQNVVWGYGDTLSFQATQACTVECTEVDVTEFDGFDDVSLSVDYVSYNLYRSNSITAISRVVAPEGIVEEYGTILKTANVKSGATNDNYETQKAAVNNKDNYKVTNKSGVFKSTQMISNTNQFAYNFYSAQNYDKMYVGAVAYAKLTNGSYVYSDVVTYEFIR